MGILGCIIVGCLARKPRYKQLAIVALRLWVVSSIIIAQVSLFMEAIGIIHNIIMAVIGGVLSYVFTWSQQCVGTHCPSPPSDRNTIKDQIVGSRRRLGSLEQTWSIIT